MADFNNNKIRRCDATNRTSTLVTTYKSLSSYPIGLLFSSDLKYLYCSLIYSNQIKKIEVSTATIIATYGTGKYLVYLLSISNTLFVYVLQVQLAGMMEV